MIRVLIFTALAFLFTGNDDRQKAASDLTKIDHMILDAKALKMELVYKAYSVGGTKPLETRTAYVEKKGTAFYGNYSTVEFISNDTLKCCVDHINRRIFIDTTKSHLKQPDNSIPDLDAAVKLCKSVVYQSLSANLSKYTFNYNKGAYSRIEVYFDPTTYILNQISIYLSQSNDPTDGGRLEVFCRHIDFSPNGLGKNFSARRFIRISDKKFLPQSSYRNYKIITY